MPTNTRVGLPERARAVVEQFSLRNFVLALVAATLVGSISAAMVLREPEVHESRAVLLIDNPLAFASAGDDGTILKLDRLRTKYATLAHTQVIANPVAKTVGTSAGTVLASTDVVAAPASLSLVVAARAGRPADAVALAAAMSKAIVDYVVEEHETNSIPVADRFVFRVVQPAKFAVKTAPSARSARASGGIAFLVALLVSYVGFQLLRAPVLDPVGPARRSSSSATG